MGEYTSKIMEVVVDTVKELAEEKDNKMLLNANSDTQLYGAQGELDSLSLVLLISNIEEKISDEFGKNITLADEKAMSQKNSPFLSIKTLSEYINKLLNDDN